MKKRLFLRAGSALATGLALSACGGGGGGGGGVIPGGDTLLGVIQGASRFSLLQRAVNRAGLDSLLAGSSALTFFAPDNAAFDRLAQRIGLGDGQTLVDTLSPGQWAGIVRFSLLQGVHSAASLRRDVRFDTEYSFNGDPTQLIFVDDGGFFIWDGIGRLFLAIDEGDIGASNGVLHVPNDVILPRGVLTVAQMLRASIDFYSDFASAMTATDVAGELEGGGPFTVFAPFNEASGALNTATQVRHHVIQQNLVSSGFPKQVGGFINLMTLSNRSTTLRYATGQSGGRTRLATLSDTSGPTASAVVDVDFYARNGVIHTIDKVLVL